MAASGALPLVLYRAHSVWAGVPEVPTLASLLVIVAVAGVPTATSLAAARRRRDERVLAGRDAG